MENPILSNQNITKDQWLGYSSFSQRRINWAKQLIFCFRMIKLDFVFLSDFRDGNMSPLENLIRIFDSNRKKVL